MLNFLFLFFNKNCQIISESGCTILHSHHEAYESSSCSTYSNSIFRLLNFSHSGEYIMVPCGFHLCSSDE